MEWFLLLSCVPTYKILIKSILKRLIQLLFLLIISYAGSFIVVEEGSEKTEKTERSEEALHYHFHSKRYGRIVKLNTKKQSSQELTATEHFNTISIEGGQHPFNIDHMYFTSHLKQRFRHKTNHL